MQTNMEPTLTACGKDRLAGSYHGPAFTDNMTTLWGYMMIESAEEFVRLRKSDRPEDYNRAAHEEASIELWRDVISRYPDMRQWVAHNKTVPIDILAVLARDPDNHVRLMVAMKRKLTQEILETLAVDNDESVRLRVAMHRRTSREVLERLANDPWVRVREVAGRKLADSSGG